MDPISLWLLITAGMWVLDNDEKQNQLIEEQQAYIEQMDGTLFRLIGSHAAASATSNMNDEDLQGEIRRLENEIDRLDDRIDIMNDPAARLTN